MESISASSLDIFRPFLDQILSFASSSIDVLFLTFGIIYGIVVAHRRRLQSS
jgi:hypothetical protein